jgi:PAS domain S-box-containing protein
VNRYLNNATVKLQLFYPIFIGFIIAAVLITVLLVDRSKRAVFKLAEESLELELVTIKKMFERERELKLEKVITDLKMAHELFYDQKIHFTPEKIEINAVNQITRNTHPVSISTFKLGKKQLYNSREFTDKTFELFGITTTIFQKIDSGFLRISTNVLKKDGERAVGTFIPSKSPVIQTILQGETYYGRAFVVNDWYITAYEPIYYNGEIVGILYVGDKEKDLDKLNEVIHSLNIGKTGYVFVFDKSGQMVINPGPEEMNRIDFDLIRLLERSTDTIFSHHDQQTGKNYLIASTYYDDFEFHITSIVPTSELTETAITGIIIRAVVIGVLATIFFVVIILMTTTRRVHRLLNSIEQSNQQLQSARQALKETEENFKTLFDNSTDEIMVSSPEGKILEVNQVVCDDLGYKRTELIGKHVKDLKPEKFRYHVTENRNETINKGKHQFESENLTKDGRTVAVEIKSRLFDYQGEKAILSISRLITERKELERKVLSAVIKTEEKERERFSKDMHDGLGPLLSTVKLYVNELNSDEITKEEKESFTEQINEMLDQAVASTREISNNLMPRVIHEYGLIKAVESFSEKVNRTKKLDIQFEHLGIDESLDADLQLILFRVISELINNTIKHARAKNIKIRLTKDDDHISLAFEDDGIGFNTDKVMNNPKTGIGLKSIISRVKSVNGRVIFKSFEGHGFKIYIDI